MPHDAQHLIQNAQAAEIARSALGRLVKSVTRQGLSESGNAVFRIEMADGTFAVLRTAPGKKFAFTRRNLDVLRALGLPVQNVLAAGQTAAGASFIILSWVDGRDLIYELGAMNDAQMTRLAEQVVDYQNRVLKLPAARRFGWAPIALSGPLERWTDVFGTPAQGNVHDGTTLGQLRRSLCGIRAKLEEYFAAVRPNPFLDDLTTRNVIVREGALSGFIDVDFVCYGDPLLNVGATLASIAADAPEGEFYGQELVRLWNPQGQRRMALWFYAALWAIGTLALNDCKNVPRAQALEAAARKWLQMAEDEGRVTVSLWPMGRTAAGQAREVA